MQKCALFIVVAIIFGALGFGFARFCPIAAPKTVGVKEVLKINSSDALISLRDAKAAELAKVLEQMTDADSARQNRPAAEEIYLQMQLIGARHRMFSSNGAPVPLPAVSDDHPLVKARNELQRIAKSEEIHKELTGSLMPLFRDQQIAVNRAANSGYALMSQLQTLRSQIELYKLQHADNYPDFKKYGWKQLTYKTNNAGQIGDAKLATNSMYGPYIIAPPQNPLTKSSEVLVVDSLPENFKANGSYGFVFDETRGRLFALVAGGQIFDEASVSADVR